MERHAVPVFLDGERADKVVAVLGGVSRAIARQVVDEGGVRVDGEPITPRRRLSSGDTIEFELPTSGPVSLRVFDLRGRLVRVLAEGETAAGVHRVVWNGLDVAGQSVASGTYFYELRTSDRMLVRKMGLLK